MQVGVVFPGQGSQIAGMGEDLCKEFPQVRELYEQASTVLGYDLLAACQNKNGELNDTRIVQPAVLVHSVACWQLMQAMLEQPVQLMTGHSLGEISAAVCAGGLEFSQAVSLIKIRAELMSSCAQDGGMMVVFALGEAPIAEVCAEIARPDHYIAIANHNAAEQWVLSGHQKALQEAAVRLENLGGVVKHLNISVPAHSLLMAPIVAQFEEAIRQAGPKLCQIPLISCVSNAQYAEPEELISMLGSQLTGCINWPRTVSTLLEKGIDTIVELGPKTVLRDLIRLEHPGVCALSFGTVEEKPAVQRFLKTACRRADMLAAAWSDSQVEGFLLSCLRLIVGTPCLKDLSPTSFQQTIQIPYQKLISNLDALRALSAQHVDITMPGQIAQCTLSMLHAKGFAPRQYKLLLEQAAAGYRVQDAIAEYLV
ncbi:MAG TPA: ACP S-malonyltransferase [Ktedonosporobacter sp.]|jgi:[acyl-carrier-protein] S-malonyltransferase|nr:ACP S-malonyltransferase [Ktedonosporobacter sp.]